MYKIYYKIVTYCFDSLAIRLQSEHLEHLIPRPGSPGLQGYHLYTFRIVQKKLPKFVQVNLNDMFLPKCFYRIFFYRNQQFWRWAFDQAKDFLVSDLDGRRCDDGSIQLRTWFVGRTDGHGFRSAETKCFPIINVTEGSASY